jgi:phosphoglycolate phosphatase
MHVLFDLDGTLTDSAPGIVRCINHALVAEGHGPVAGDRLRPMIGAPLTTIFRTLLGSDDAGAIDRAVERYRQRFNLTGLFENSLFPGVREALEDLARAGHRFQIVTAKPRAVAERVLDHFQIAGYFAAVRGPAIADRTCDKSALIAAALRATREGRDAAVMIGDRADDIHAAHQCHARAVAVGWGYGTRDELLAAEPDYFAPTVADMVQWVHTADRLRTHAWRLPHGAE